MPAASAGDPAVVPIAPSTSLSAILENNITHSQIAEWLSSSTRDISARLVQFSSSPDDFARTSSASYSSSAAAAPHTHCPRSQRSGGSSMAPACIHQSSNASTHPPSLYHYSEATPTETSISTGLASRFSGVPLLEEVNGVLERQRGALRQPIFECSFWFLSCSYISTDQEEWRVHCLSHFRSEEPPKSVSCPLCEEFKYTCENGWRSWELRMEHMAYHHLVGNTLRTSRPDFHLFQHLWSKRLIDDQDLKELKGGNHNLTKPPMNYTVTGRREPDAREGRGRRRQHIGVAALRRLTNEPVARSSVFASPLPRPD
ncbi:hypothetical protein P154DRAFT_524599 [Amniculicola lignicola CBS 123094]|uniref:Uncharacterized protein n=1 Tax=Amniculicola lignicola CBS 123094 TaxID=1392246 RepID=A0A6A5WC68_9PLEO|nr:hypothetical protein P154DRAFT_524599 [Amniculicola lignicola CBS 123094]